MPKCFQKFLLIPLLRPEFLEETYITMWRFHHVSIMGVIQGDKRPMTVGRWRDRKYVGEVYDQWNVIAYGKVKLTLVANGGDIQGPLYLQAVGKLKKQLCPLCMCFTTKWNIDDSILYAWIFVLVSNVRNITGRAWKYASMLKSCKQLKKSQVND